MFLCALRLDVIAFLCIYFCTFFMKGANNSGQDRI